MPLTRPLTAPLVRSPLRSAFDVGTGGGAAVVYPLDEVGGDAPIMAMGNKKLRAAYDGPCIRVKRASDSAEQDVGFAVDGKVDAAALDAFLGEQDGQIVVVYDQSGNGNNWATTHDPAPFVWSHTMGGARALSFLGTIMDLPPALAVNRRPLHYFTVAEHIAPTAYIEFGTEAGAQVTFFTGSSSGGYMRLNAGTSNTPFHPMQKPVLLEAKWGATESRVHQNHESLAGAAVPIATLTGGKVGATVLAGGLRAQFHMATTVCYARELSEPEREVLRAALGAMYPYPANPNRVVVFEGDSLTAGASTQVKGAMNFSRQLSQNLDAMCFNFGGGGKQAPAAISNFNTTVGLPLARYADADRIVFLHIGTNDISIANRTAAQVYDDIVAYAGVARAAGAKIIVSTILPASGWVSNSTRRTVWETVNAGIRANWASFADGFADFQAIPEMGPLAASQDIALYPDGLHPSRLGHSYLAPVAAAAINALL